MKTNPDYLKSLATRFSELLEREKGSFDEAFSSLLESIRIVKGATGDKRLQHLLTQTKKLQERFDLLAQMAQQDFLAKICHEVEELKSELIDSRLAAVLRAIIQVDPLPINDFCQTLLDCLIETTGARRGFALLYLPESTEAEVIGARNFETTNLSLQEHAFSRTILRSLLQTGKPPTQGNTVCGIWNSSRCWPRR
jgi:hypothetical protein